MRLVHWGLAKERNIHPMYNMEQYLFFCKMVNKMTDPIWGGKIHRGGCRVTAKTIFFAFLPKFKRYF